MNYELGIMCKKSERCLHFLLVCHARGNGHPETSIRKRTLLYTGFPREFTLVKAGAGMTRGNVENAGIYYKLGLGNS